MRSTSYGRAGQSLAEFALVLPILALLLFGTIQLGITFGGYNGLINSVREAARFGSVCIGPPATCGASTATYLATQKIPGSVFGYRGSSAGARIEYQTYSDGTSWSVRIRVTGCASGIIFIPLVGQALGLADPSSFPLKSVETFRVEGQPTSAPASGIAQDPNWTLASTSGAACP